MLAISRYRAIGLLLAVIGLAGCSAQRISPTSDHRHVLARNVIPAGDATIAVAAIHRGSHFRVIQWSRVVSLDAEVHAPDGALIVAGRLGDHAEWFTGRNLLATASVDGRWVFLFRHFDPPIEGKTISKRDLPADQVLRYGSCLVGAIDLQQRAVITGDSLRDPAASSLLTHPTVVLAGVAVAADASAVTASPVPGRSRP